MKIVKIQKEERTFNGTPYKYFSIFANDNGRRVVIGCSGSTYIQVVDADTGEYISPLYRLHEFGLKAGDEIDVWYQDQSQRVAQIDFLKKVEA